MWITHPGYLHYTDVTHREFLDRVSLSLAKVKDLTATLLHHYTYAAAEAFPIINNIGIMASTPPSPPSPPPPPPRAARSLLTNNYNIYLLQNAITRVMCDQIGNVRHDHMYSDQEWIHHHSDSSGPEDSLNESVH
jgi:hypothetical protein